MEEIMQVTAALLLIVVYVIYLKQTIKGESTPNPGTWIAWFVIMGINTVTYFKVVNDDYFKSAIVFVGFISVTLIMVYSLLRGKFVKLTKVDIWLLALSIIIGIFWQATKKAEVSNLLLQIVIFVSFLPTAIGLIQGRLKEKHTPWTLAAIAYSLQTASLLINYNGNLYELFLPIINGIMGNGMITVIIFYQDIKMVKAIIRRFGA